MSGKLKIGITIGDINGIGPEIILKTFLNPDIYELCTPIVYGSGRVLSYYKNLIEGLEFNFNTIKSVEQAQEGYLSVINCWNEESRVELGVRNPQNGKFAIAALEAATQDVLNGKIDAVVTAPIDKMVMKESGFQFPGHTEYFQSKFPNEKSMMLMLDNRLKITMVTGHLALKDVSKNLSTENIYKKIKQLESVLISDFGVRKPKIAVLALNPHAGDQGMFGDEEAKHIQPACEKAQKEGILAFGPFSPDGFFASLSFKNFDTVLAMYHDQALIPFKLLSGLDGVNYTAGLPIVRTSPDHGTAFDIAGKNIASESSIRNAIYAAIDIVRCKRIHKEINANPLKNVNIELPRGKDDFAE